MMRKKTTIISVFALVLVFTAAGICGVTIDNKIKNELYKQVGLFSDSLAIIQDEYVDEVSPKDLIYGALKGMLSALDPHSQFLDPDVYNELKVNTEGRFGGLGIEITIKDGLLTVITPIEDTPAWKAGLKANDRIVKIENELTRDMTLTDAVKKLRGKPGDPVKITVLRESEKKLLDFTIIRDIIKIRDIKEAKMLEDSIGYIKLVEFSENTPYDMNKALVKLKQDGMKGLILDLRNNPGGLLDVAVKVAEDFIDKGKLIVYTKGRKPHQNMEYSSRTGDSLEGMPMVVMINEGSASGSEIVAGALQDYKRAVILGVRSFGKGSVQTVVPLSDGSALKITTSRYYTPSGKQIHGNGVTPDIEAIQQAVAKEETKDETEEKIEEVFDNLEKKEAAQETPAYKEDLQLVRATDALKAMIIYKDSH